MFKTLFFFILVLFCSLQASTPGHYHLEQGDSESFVAVTPRDLICEDGNIFIEFNAMYHPVRSLIRSGTQWLAILDGKNSFCPRGHNVCGLCDQCHTNQCPFAVLPPCWTRR